MKKQVGRSKVLTEDELKEKAIHREFRLWKRELHQMIERGCSIAKGKTGHTFILPSELCNLVWATTVRERMKLQDISPTGAIKSIKADLDEKVAEKTGAVDAIEEEKAARELARIRAQLVKGDN